MYYPPKHGKQYCRNEAVAPVHTFAGMGASYYPAQQWPLEMLAVGAGSFVSDNLYFAQTSSDIYVRHT